MTDKFKVIYENSMRNLNNVIRYSGVFCIKPETDGYHTIDMMAMCMKIADIIEDAQRNSDTQVVIDRRDLVYRCYLHDMDESLMGDISRNIKYYNDNIYNAVSGVVDDLMKSNYSKEIVDDIKSSKDKDNICGLIVKVSDTLQSSMKIYEECKLGNFHFEKVIKENVLFVENLRNAVLGSSLTNIYPEAINVIIDIIDDFKTELKSEIENNIR
jgi:5'-deoxynucleotidase YfbR-like HD superfamily hydrolase